MKKNIYTIIIALFSLFMFSKNSLAYDTIVAVVNNQAITTQDFETRKRMLISLNNIDPKTYSDPRFNKAVIDALVSDLIFSQYASESGIGISASDIDNAMIAIEANNKMPKGYLIRYLNDKGITKEMFASQLKSELIKNKLSQQFAKTVNITEKDIQEFVINSNQKPIKVDFKVISTLDDSKKSYQILKNLKRQLEKTKNFDSAQIQNFINKNELKTEATDTTIDKIQQNQYRSVILSINQGDTSSIIKMDNAYKIIFLNNIEILNLSTEESKYVLNFIGNNELSKKIQSLYTKIKRRSYVKIISN
jgi:parvulin-like peptidyl-prolyl isomerase